MSIFYPTMLMKKISDIKLEILVKFGVSALILDVDNTLATHNNPIPDEDVLVWLEDMRAGGIKLIIASNNNKRRVEPFAHELGLDYTASAMKPLPVGFLRVAKRLELPAKSFGVVGDQIFTDILGGNLFGSTTFLVEPLKPETTFLFRMKRKLETVVLKEYRKKHI